MNNWHKLGFILRNGSQHTEFDRCDMQDPFANTDIEFPGCPAGPDGDGEGDGPLRSLSR